VLIDRDKARQACTIMVWMAVGYRLGGGWRDLAWSIAMVDFTARRRRYGA